VSQHGLLAQRRILAIFSRPDEAYPFGDGELRQAVTAVFLAMEQARSGA